jgi:hypothetical protein
VDLCKTQEHRLAGIEEVSRKPIFEIDAMANARFVLSNRGVQDPQDIRQCPAKTRFDRVVTTIGELGLSAKGIFCRSEEVGGQRVIEPNLDRILLAALDEVQHSIPVQVHHANSIVSLVPGTREERELKGGGLNKCSPFPPKEDPPVLQVEHVIHTVAVKIRNPSVIVPPYYKVIPIKKGLNCIWAVRDVVVIIVY